MQEHERRRAPGSNRSPSENTHKSESGTPVGGAWSPIVQEFLKRRELRSRGGLNPTLPAIDAYLGGGIVAGRPLYIVGDQKRGKTGMVLQIARPLLMGRRGLLLYGDGNLESQIARLIGQIEDRAWKSVYLEIMSEGGDVVAEVLQEHCPDLAALPIGPSPMEQVNSLGYLPDLIMVDAIQDAGRALARGGDLRLATAEVTRELRALAQRGAYVIGASHSTRNSDGKHWPEPKEAGDIEQDAGALILLGNGTREKRIRVITESDPAREFSATFNGILWTVESDEGDDDDEATHAAPAPAADPRWPEWEVRILRKLGEKRTGLSAAKLCTALKVNGHDRPALNALLTDMAKRSPPPIRHNGKPGPASRWVLT